MNTVHIGTSGYSYRHWRNLFYPSDLPQAKWLTFYTEHFNTLEVNATFYRSFGPLVYQRWYDTTPEDFSYVLKGPLTITRYKRLKNAESELGQFFESISPLKEKLKVVLWQMPPSFKCSAETLQDIETFFSNLPSHIRYALELRHSSWVNDKFFALLNTYKVGWVSADSKRFLSYTTITGGLGYIRLHGPGALYSSSYTDAQLEEWAEVIKDMQSEGEVYCFFNNDLGGHAVKNAALLRTFIGS